MLGRFETIHFRHADVHQHNIDGTFLHQLEQLPAILCFANQFHRKHFRHVFQKIPEAVTRRRLVICHRNAQLGPAHQAPFT